MVLKLNGGIVCYELFVKEQILNIPQLMIAKCTAESAEVSPILAQQASELFNSKISVAVTGQSTPRGSETKEKPGVTFFYSYNNAHSKN